MRKELLGVREPASTSLAPALMAQAAAMLEADAPAVPQEPVRNDMSIQLLERLIKTLTNLGYATPEGGIEAFNADLPTQLYHLCFGVDRVLSALKTAVPQEPVAYLAWRDGKPCWEGDDCVCADAVYPVDHYDDRTSMPVYLAPQPQQPRLTTDEITKAWESVKGTAFGYAPFARAIERKVRGEA